MSLEQYGNDEIDKVRFMSSTLNRSSKGYMSGIG
jgi:hypothetical protein